MMELNSKQTKVSRKGFAMIAVLGYVVVIAILSTAFIRSLHFSLGQQQSIIRDSKSYVMAENGFQYASIELNKNTEYPGGDITLQQNQHITLDIHKDSDTSWTIRSTGKIGTTHTPLSTTVLESRLQKTTQGWLLHPPKQLRKFQWNSEVGT